MVRCENCGEVRWSILGGIGQPESRVCDVCGEPLSVERRRPGRRFFTRAKGERRDFRPTAPPPDRRPRQSS